MVRPEATYSKAYVGILANGERRRKPFAHVVCEQVYAPALADETLGWLETGVPWQLHESSFYEQYECDLLSVPYPSSCIPLFGQDVLAKLKSRMEALFETEFTDRVEVVAHKLTPGQGIGLHNDDPRGDLELETHRLIVQLNRGSTDQNGGHLLLFNSNSPSDIYGVVRPVHNTGLAVAFSEKSYHAVTDIREGTRYTVLYSFWQIRAANETLSADRSTRAGNDRDMKSAQLDADEAASTKELVHLLTTVGADGVGHSDQDLLSHLINTYKILRRWKCPRHVCVAGLFHSIYGSEAFKHAVVSLQQRQLVRGFIGSEAEQLAYIYCVASEEGLYDNLDRAEPYVVRNRIDGTNISITRECFADLITLVLANSLEQLPRISCSPKGIEAEWTILEKAVDLLPSDAVVEMRWVYGRRNSFESRLATLDPEAQARVEKALEEALAKELTA